MDYTNVALEEMVLGTLSHLSDPHNEILMDAIDRLHITCFTGYDRQQLFSIMAKNHVAGKDIADYALVTDLCAIDSKLVNLLTYLREPRPEQNSLKSWVEELNALRLDRGYSALIGNLRKDFDQSPDREAREALLATITDDILRLKDLNASSTSFLRTASQCVDDLIEEELNGESRVKTGLIDLDNFLLGGVDPASLIVIGGAPSAGKTHMGLKLLLEMHRLQPGKEAIIFSLEGKGTSVTKRLISHARGMLYKNMTPEEKSSVLKSYRKSKITVSDKQNLTFEQIHSLCKRSQIKNPLSVVMVDYLDRVKKPKGESRQDEKLAEIANGLASMAIELNCIVILTTQLNKEAIKKPDKRPAPVDSKNSSGQAEAASYWFGIKRIAQWDNGEVFPDSHLVELIVGKNRNDDREGIVYFQTENSLYFDINQELARSLVKNGNEDRQMSNMTSRQVFSGG